MGDVKTSEAAPEAATGKAALMRTAARLDANQPDIVRALEAAGLWVYSTADQGDGFHDLLVVNPKPVDGEAWPRQALVEVKDGSKPPSARKLTDKQVSFHARYPGASFVVTSVEDVATVVEKFFA